jgi:DNA-binding NarL/FixJ family response regulator
LTLLERLRPCIAIIDLGLPDLNGLDLIASAVKKKLPTHIIALTGNPDEGICARAKTLGVKGYLLKLSSPDESPLAIRTVAIRTKSMPERNSAVDRSRQKQQRNRCDSECSR